MGLTHADEETGPVRLPAHSPTCLGCGPDNPAGLHLEVFRAGQEVYTEVVFDERHIGAPGLAHGGAVAAACDDLLGFTLYLVGTPAVTRSLTVEYIAPVPLGWPHHISAWVERAEGRRLYVAGRGTADGTVRFTVSAVFITVTVEHFTRHGHPDAVQALLTGHALTWGSIPPADNTKNGAAEAGEVP